MVPIKKKKRPKKAVHHAAPDVSKLNLGAGPPAQPTAQEDATAKASTAVQSPRVESSRVESPPTPWDDEQSPAQQQEGGDYISGYQASGNEEFRNVWEGDSAPK